MSVVACSGECTVCCIVSGGWVVEDGVVRELVCDRR